MLSEADTWNGIITDKQKVLKLNVHASGSYLEFLGSNLSLETDYDEVLGGFPQSLQADAGIAP
jgi:hypothetical protein